MQIVTTSKQSVEEIIILLRAQRSSPTTVQARVSTIIERVKKEGDKTLFELTQELDGAALKNLQVTKKEYIDAIKRCSPELITALKKAKKMITQFHATTFSKQEAPVETSPGVKVWREFRPIEKVGLYVPGGLAAYPSTVMMLAIPARLAGCKEIIMCVPPEKNGMISDATLAAAYLCGVTRIFKVGGAQAIAAMAYGTQTIPKVYKIVGPGNQYVATAKMMLYGEVDIDMPAGPSEVAVVAGDLARPDFVAADLLSQLEHGTTSQALLISFSASFIECVQAEIETQCTKLKRKVLVNEALKNSVAVLVKNEREALEIINEYGPEHLELMLDTNNERFARLVNNAGSVFIGPYTCEPLGDYITGANHTLPTAGFSKMFSPLSVSSFGKMLQFQSVTRKGVQKIGPSAITIAHAEGLDAHARSIELRLTI
ncbi:histidinol dehydrogenase [Candidatus Gracilibacteria bacterium]|nr:histidinol dehydrogenase [Candidatus Gracilibacteria bacterium]